MADLNRRFAVAGVFLMVGNVIQVITGLVASLLLARWIGPEAFGRFAVVTVTVGLTLTALTLRLQVLIIRGSAAEIAGGRGRLYFSALLVETVLGAAVSLACLALLGLWDGWTVALAFSQCLAHWVSVNRAFYERSMPFRHLAVVETGAVVASHGLAIALALFGVGEAALYLREIAATALLTTLLAATGGLTWMPLRRLSWPDVSDVLREARSVWLDGLLEGGFQRLTTLVASAFGAERETGYFFMAQSLASRPHQLLSPMVTRAAVIWLRDAPDASTRRRYCKRLLLITAVPLVLGALLLIWLASPLVSILLGAGWEGATPVLIAMSGLIVFLTPFETLRSYAILTRMERKVLQARVAQYTAFSVIVVIGLTASANIAVVGIAVSAAFAAASLRLGGMLGNADRR